MKRRILPFNHYLKPIANQLRKQMTLSEVLLWNQLKQKKMPGMDFDRQRPVLNYIVDFYCKDLMLAIEDLQGILRVIQYWIEDTTRKEGFIGRITHP